ncbi:MAG: hypothetical protein GX301_10755 [Gracilibacteraceae bacterium]|nr:hypothetical protein [Gracilibacteraceae bacterium]
MSDRKLEELLKKAKVESEQFFSDWNYESLKEKVISETESRRSHRAELFGTARKLGIALACILVAVWIPYRFGALPLKTGTSVTQQAINLDDSKPSYLVDFIPIGKPDHRGQSIMAVLWGESPGGEYKVFYSSLFEDSDRTYPVSTIEFPGTGSRLALIYSEDSRQNYLHYRLIGYINEGIKALIEENLVQGGKLSIRDGVLVEQRAESNLGDMVTYIIPYLIDGKGELVLSADRLQLNVGEQLMLIGIDENKGVQFFSEENSVRKINEKNPEDISIVRYNAFSAGEDYLLLTPDSDKAKVKNLHIRVIDNR